MSAIFPNNKIKNALLLLMALGLAIRLGAAALQPNYIDEGFNFYICQQGLQSMYDHLKIDVHTPFVHLLNYPIAQCTSNIFWMRLLGVICGTLNIGVAFVLFRRFLSPQISLVLAAFLAVDFSLWQSDALFRPYGPLALAITAVSLGMVDILRTGIPFTSTPQERPASWPWPVFFLACLACASSHMLGILALIPCFIWGLFAVAPARRRTLTCIVAGALPGIAWFVLGPFLHHPQAENVSNVTYLKWSPFLDVPSNILNLTILPTLYQGPNDDLAVFFRYASESATPWLNVILYAIFAWGIYGLWKKIPKEGSFLTMLVLVPTLMLALAIVLGKMKLFQSHYVTPFTPVILLLPAYVFAERFTKNLMSILIGVAGFIAICFPGNRLIWVQDWQSAFEFIEARQHAGDHVGVNIAYAFYSFAMAYDGDNIHFSYADGTENFSHTPSPGKLVALPLRLEACNANLLDYLGSNQLFLVLCESELDNRRVPLWLDQYYEVVEGINVPSENYWARLMVLQLKRRPSPATDFPMSGSTRQMQTETRQATEPLPSSRPSKALSEK